MSGAIRRSTTRLRPLRRDDPDCRQVAGVRGDGLDRLLVAVEPEVVGALGLPPERLVEAVVQRRSPRAAAGARLRAARGSRRCRPAAASRRRRSPGARTARSAAARACRRRAGSRRRRPSSPGCSSRASSGSCTPGSRRGRGRRSVSIQRMRRLGVRQVALQERDVAEPLVEVREDDDEQARRVVRAVVRLERQDPELGQLAVADLVRDLAGLHVALGVVARWPAARDRRRERARPRTRDSR